MNTTTSYHGQLKEKMDKYVHIIYLLSKKFPKDEIFNTTSQIKRAALSVVLNFVEGYARGQGKSKVYKNFIEISYGSLQESQYLLQFVCKEGYIAGEDTKEVYTLGEEIGAMLWGILRRL